MKSGAAITLDRLADVAKSLRTLGENQVMVGVPEAKGERQDAGEITNAALAYIHSNGAPEVNIPPRPFLGPGIERSKDPIADRFKATADAALSGNTGAVERGLAGAGQIAASAAQNVIREGIAPPLKETTIEARRRRSKGSSYRRKAATASETTPLIDTGQLLRSITYVVRKR